MQLNNLKKINCIYKNNYSTINLYEDNKNIQYAIKTFIKNDLSNEILERLNIELSIIKLLMKNPHDNIIYFYDVIETNKYINIIMEYCPAGTFEEYLKNNDLSEENTKYFFKQIIDGYSHLNNLNIMHRDIKPANLLLSNDNIIKIIDFGFSKYATSILLNKTLCGTPLYMSPELLIKNEYNMNSDIWALGILLYEMVYGYNPYAKCDSIDMLIDKIKNHDLNFNLKNKQNNLISLNLLNLLKSMIEKNNIKRININSIVNHLWFKNIENTYISNINNKHIPITSNILIASNELPNIITNNISSSAPTAEKTIMAKCLKKCGKLSASFSSYFNSSIYDY